MLLAEQRDAGRQLRERIRSTGWKLWVLRGEYDRRRGRLFLPGPVCKEDGVVRYNLRWVLGARLSAVADKDWFLLNSRRQSVNNIEFRLHYNGAIRRPEWEELFGDVVSQKGGVLYTRSIVAMTRIVHYGGCLLGASYRCRKACLATHAKTLWIAYRGVYERRQVIGQAHVQRSQNILPERCDFEYT
jgi:hypothetical protein